MQVDESKPIKVHPVIVNDLLNQSIVNQSASEIHPIDEFLKQIDENQPVSSRPNRTASYLSKQISETLDAEVAQEDEVYNAIYQDKGSKVLSAETITGECKNYRIQTVADDPGQKEAQLAKILCIKPL